MMNRTRTMWAARLIGGALIAFCATCCIVARADAEKPALQEPERLYEGTIKSIPIQMTLQRDGATGVLGKYRYVKIGKDLKLQGIVRGGDSLTLWEYDEKWNTTGVFTGRYTARASDGAWESIEGVWTKPNGAGTPAPFSVRLRDAAPSAQTMQKSLSASEVNGRYKRAGKNSAEINVQLLASGEVKIEGEATWASSPQTTNLGDIWGVCKLQGNQALYADKDLPCNLTITFEKNSLIVAGDLSDGSCGGRNVSFNGVYKRVSAKPTFRPTRAR